MPELKEFTPPVSAGPQPQKNKQFSTLLLLVFILIGLVLIYWILSRPPQVLTAKPTRGVTNVFSIYGIDRKDMLREPNAVHVDKDGDIYVADTGNHRVVVFTAQGRYKRKISVRKNSKKFTKGDLVSPLGVTVDKNGRVWTASLDTGIMIFSPTGQKLRQMPIQAIQVHAAGDRVYATTPGSIYVFNSRWDIVQHIGSKGRGYGQLESPHDLVRDKKGNLIVSDSQNMRIQLFNKKGEVFAYKGEPPKSLNDSGRMFGLGTGITMDDAGRVYVTDAFHHAIRVFDEKGNDLGEIGEQGDADGLFNYPSDVFFMGGNSFAVADKWNDRIQIVRLNPGEARSAGTEAKPLAQRLPIWVPVIGVLVLLAIVLLAVRRFSRRAKYSRALQN